MPGTPLDSAAMAEHAAQAAALLKRLAHPARLRVLCRLVEGEAPVPELQALTGLSASALSQHLAVLRQAGVVNTRKDGINVYYSLRSDKISQACSLTRQILLERLEDQVNLSDLIRKTGD